MSLTLAPLPLQAFSAQALRVVAPDAPAPAKMMAAKGLIPLGPKELTAVLYQLSFDADTQIATAATATATGLPDNILSAALADMDNSHVIEFFALKVAQRGPLIEKVLLNRATDDSTFIKLASILTDRELELMSTNQQRLLRCPAIIEALYFNRHTRMSTVDRMLELAVRNGLNLTGIPQFKAIAANILGVAPPMDDDDASADGQNESLLADPSLAAAAQAANQLEQTGSTDYGAMDDLFSAVLSEDWDAGPIGDLEYDGQEAADPKALRISALPINAKIRLANLGNQSHRNLLIRDTNRLVAMAVIRSPQITEQEAAKHASNRAVIEEVIRYIATKKEWQKNYAIKLALVYNPKCSLTFTLRLLPHLRANDLRMLSRSKNIPAALAKAAKEAASKRG